MLRADRRRQEAQTASASAAARARSARQDIQDHVAIFGERAVRHHQRQRRATVRDFRQLEGHAPLPVGDCSHESDERSVQEWRRLLVFDRGTEKHIRPERRLFQERQIHAVAGGRDRRRAGDALDGSRSLRQGRQSIGGR